MGGPAGLEPGKGPFYGWADDDDDMLQCEECHKFSESVLHGLCTECQVAQFEEESQQGEAEIKRGK